MTCKVKLLQNISLLGGWTSAGQTQDMAGKDNQSEGTGSEELL